MSKSDIVIIIILIVSILTHVSIGIIGLITHKLLNYLPFLNALSGLILVTYWVQKQLRITQHIFEMREMVVLCGEVLVVGVSIYTIVSTPMHFWLKMIQFVVFTLHLSALLLFAVFMLTFKMNKLF